MPSAIEIAKTVMASVKLKEDSHRTYVISNSEILAAEVIRLTELYNKHVGDDCEAIIEKHGAKE